MRQAEITITNPVGLHARPAKELVIRAKASSSNITVIAGDKKVNAKSMLGILKLGAPQGTTITVEIDGDDADQVIADFTAILSKEG